MLVCYSVAFCLDSHLDIANVELSIYIQKIFRSEEEKGRALKLNKERRLAQVSLCFICHNWWWSRLLLTVQIVSNLHCAGEEAKYLGRAIRIEPIEPSACLEFCIVELLPDCRVLCICRYWCIDEVYFRVVIGITLHYTIQFHTEKHMYIVMFEIVVCSKQSRHRKGILCPVE